MWLNNVDRDTYNRWLQELQRAIPEVEVKVSYSGEQLDRAEAGYWWDGQWQRVQYERYPLTPEVKRYIDVDGHAVAMARATLRFN